MKTLVLKIASITLLFVLFSSCKEKGESINLLKQAQNIVENNPTTALALLDSISHPEDMDKENYMEYIVTRVRAKYRNKQDVTSDTLIFDAERYFSTNYKSAQNVFAHYYAGVVYNRKGMFDESFQCFLQAENSAEKVGNIIMTGRSLHAIANLYFAQEMMDSAIVCYHESLEYYNKEKDTNQYKVQVINLIGRSYEANNNLDSAYAYFNKGLDLAKELNDQAYIGKFSNNLGVIFLNKKAYKQAKNTFSYALTKPLDTEDSLKVCINLSEIYNRTNQLDSSKYFTDMIKERISTIEDNYILKSIYRSLSDYNAQSGNTIEALYYKNLQMQTSEKICNANNALKLLDTEKKYQINIHEKEQAAVRQICIIIGIFAVLLIISFAYFRNKYISYKYQQEVEKNELLKKQYDLKIESMVFLRNIYRNIVCEWINIDKEVEELALEYGATEKPSIYMRIKELVNNLEHNSNQQLRQWAKDYMEKDPVGKKAVQGLNDSDLLLLGLCCYEYSKSDIATILGIPIQKVHTRKLALKHKFKEAGMTEIEIEHLLFTNNNA